MALATKDTLESPRADPLHLSVCAQGQYQQYNAVSARAKTVLQYNASGHQPLSEYSSYLILPRLAACDSANRALLTPHTLHTLGASLCLAPAAVPFLVHVSFEPKLPVV